MDAQNFKNINCEKFSRKRMCLKDQVHFISVKAELPSCDNVMSGQGGGQPCGGCGGGEGT